MTDARRREVYWARYDAAGSRVVGPQVSKPAELVDELRGVPVVGAGAHAYADVLAGLDLRAEPLYPSPSGLVAIVAPRIGSPAEPLVPLYLRRPDAEQPGPPKRVTA
jgi:tRNA A37 threonylcarbamoyladenosine modification protein TsaB